MKIFSESVIAAAALFVSAGLLHAYERLQGPTEVLYWNKTNAYAGYTFFGVRSNTYLINMEGNVVHTWPLGTNPRLLTNGNILGATSGDVSSFTTLKEVDWNGSTVWEYIEARTNYVPHHDFIRIYNPKLGTNTTLYIAAKTVSSNACIAAGCNPANGPYTNAQVDAVVEVDMAGNVVWEWCFFDHGIQDFDASKSNYVGAGKSISNYVGRLNLNLPGRPVSNDWLHCNSIDYNQSLDQIVINAAGGEFYVIDHGNTFVAGNPAASITLAASTNGDFLYRFGDPARYSQGNPPSIQLNWTTSTTGHKQIGGSSHAQWIASGLSGAGHFLVYNNGGDLFETTPQSYIFEINGYLNASTNDTGAYVNPPTANYNNWAAPGHDTDKRTKSMSKQITWMYYSMANQGMFSHLDSSVQRLPNGNTLICDSIEGHIFEVTATGDAVWEYINPVSADGIITYKRDSYPMQNAVFRAYRFATNHPAFTGRTLTPASTISGQSPSYISAPSISGTTFSPASQTATNCGSVVAQIINRGGVASATLTYTVANVANSVDMLDDGLHQDGVAGDGIYSAQIPAFPAGTTVSYYVSAQDQFGNSAADSLRSYTVQAGPPNLPPVLGNITQRPAIPTSADPVTISAVATDDVTVASVTLSYSIGTGASATNTMFSETMAAAAVKPWAGTGCDNIWTVFTNGLANPFQQATNANYGSGGLCGLTFKGGTTNLSDSMITTALGINAQGNSGTLTFYMEADSLSGTAGWAMQLNPGTGFTTRLSELSASNHVYQLYTYTLQPSDLVSNLSLRFLFCGNSVNSRMELDQIALKVVAGGSIASNITMSAAGGSIYHGQIPAQPAGTSIAYSVTARDAYGLTTNASGFSYLVMDATNLPVANFIATPTQGGAPLAVAFTDNSTGMITNRFWNYGDGFSTNTTFTSVLHTYAFPGTNTVQLIVTGPLGSSTNTQTGIITATAFDTVGDGIPDWWRAQFFGGTGAATNSQSCSAGDPDGDGMSNWQEYLADTQPTNGASLLALVGLAPQTNGMCLTWIGGTTALQIVEFRRNLAGTTESWAALFTNVPPTAVTNSFLDVSSGTNGFYRIKAAR